MLIIFVIVIYFLISYNLEFNLFPKKVREKVFVINLSKKEVMFSFGK
jgi:hypothetical protein